MGALDNTYAGMTGSYWLAIGAVAVVGGVSQLVSRGSRSLQQYAGQDQAFQQWLGEVDRLLLSSVGVGFLDLRDVDWYMAFEEGMEPDDAIEYLFGVGVGYPRALIESAMWG